jgi:hypothetical protein
VAAGEKIHAHRFESSRNTISTRNAAWREVPTSTVVSEPHDVMEPISPELVLVDPELAARVRALPIDLAAPYALRRSDGLTRAAKRTPYQALPALRPARADGRPGRSRVYRRLSRSVVAISLMAAGFVAASAVSGAQGEQPRLAPASVGASVSPPVSAAKTTVRARSPVKPQRRSDSTAKRQRATTPKTRKQPVAPTAGARETSAAVERKLLSVIVQSPAGKLPPALINRATGLAKNNLQAVCTRGEDSRSFLCVVRSALQPAAGTVYALYRSKKGGGHFTWYRSRSG